MESKTDFRNSDSGTERSQTVAARTKRPAARGVRLWTAQSTVIVDRHMLEVKEVLADILACIFAGAQGMGEPGKEKDAAYTTIHSGKCVGAR